MSEERKPTVFQRRQLAGAVLTFSLGVEDDALRERAATASDGRAAKTLVEQGPLRITLVALTPGTALQPHQVAGPVSIQTIRGTLRITTDAGDVDLPAGDLITFGAGVAHTVQALDDCAMLLTVTMP